VTALLYGLALKARDGAPRSQLRRIVEQSMTMWPRRRTTPR